MKVMIITCHTPFNYGAVLQAYALQTYIENTGNNAQIINYCPKRTKSFRLFRFLVFLIRWPDYLKCRKVFGFYLHKYLHLTQKANSFEELKDLRLCAELYIAGSDQIWNVKLRNGKDPSYFLKFATGGTKISYAASIALEHLDDIQKELLKGMVYGLDAVSVREESAVGLLEDCGFREVYHVIDPVFLLSQKEWIAFSSGSEYKDKYVLIYGFCRQREIYRYARKLAQKLGCKVYAVNTLWSDIRFDIDRYFWAPSVNEFVNLVYRAEAVVTNSFHGLSFSLIFQKNIHVFNTVAGGSVRLTDMLKLVSLEGRLIAKDFKDVLTDEVDFMEVNQKLEEMVGKSKQYLQKYLDERK